MRARGGLALTPFEADQCGVGCVLEKVERSSTPRRVPHESHRGGPVPIEVALQRFEAADVGDALKAAFETAPGTFILFPADEDFPASQRRRLRTNRASRPCEMRWSLGAWLQSRRGSSSTHLLQLVIDSQVGMRPRAMSRAWTLAGRVRATGGACWR